MSGLEWCSSCTEDVAPFATMNGAAQLVTQCPKCEKPLGGAITRPLADFDKATQRIMPVVAPKPQADVIRLPTPPKPKTQAAPSTPEAIEPPRDVLGMVRDRLAYLEAEIAKRAGLELEAKKLRKMLAAADRVSASGA